MIASSVFRLSSTHLFQGLNPESVELSLAWTVFEYLYRDADNHKAFGKVAFCGSVPLETWDCALQKLDDGTHFIAEQVGLPPLYGQLLHWSDGGPTDADHCWHEFVSVSTVEEDDLPTAVLKLGKVATFVERLSAVKEWNIWLSPNVECGTPKCIG